MRIAVLLLGLMLVLSTAALANGNTPTGVGTTPTTSTTTTTTDTGTITTTPPVGSGPTVPTGTTMQPGTTTTTTTTTMVETMSPEVEAFNTQFLSNFYGLSSSTISSLRSQGFTWGEINFMANMAARTQRPITEIAMYRSQGSTWPEIAGRYNVALTDVTTPFMPTSRVAGFTGQTGMMTMGMVGVPPYYLSDRYGNPVLTPTEAQAFIARGYDWRSIAVAANISARTGVPVHDILSMTDRGMTFSQIAMQYGLRPEYITDVSLYPYSHENVTVTTTTTTYGTAPVGAGPGIYNPVNPMMTQPTPSSTPSTTNPSPSTTTPSY